MNDKMDASYYKGYCIGYWDGYQAAMESGLSRGFGKRIENSVGDLPIEAMEISSRARNCLRNAGCSCVADITALSQETLETMRNLGPRTAREIARWLEKQELLLCAWSRYL